MGTVGTKLDDDNVFINQMGLSVFISCTFNVHITFTTINNHLKSWSWTIASMAKHDVRPPQILAGDFTVEEYGMEFHIFH